VSDEEWAFVAPYLTLQAPDALQRKHDLRAAFNGLRYLAHTGAHRRTPAHTGAPWRYLPGDFPPWAAVYPQARRWMAAGCFEALVHDVRLLLRVLQGRAPQPTAAILDARVLQSSPESGARAGDNGHKRCKGATVHASMPPSTPWAMCWLWW
jgi:transposase